MTSSVLEPPVETSRQQPAQRGLVDVGAVSDFVSGQPTRVEGGGRALVVVRRGDEFFALRDICPHQRARLSAGTVSGTSLPCRVGETVPWGREGEIVSCPWHGWEFDLRTGRSLADPHRVRVRCYPVRVSDGRVWVDVRTRSVRPVSPTSDFCPTACSPPSSPA